MVVHLLLTIYSLILWFLIQKHALNNWNTVTLLANNLNFCFLKLYIIQQIGFLLRITNSIKSKHHYSKFWIAVFFFNCISIVYIFCERILMIEKNHFFKVKWELEKFTFSIFSEHFLRFLKCGISNLLDVSLASIFENPFLQF